MLVVGEPLNQHIEEQPDLCAQLPPMGGERNDLQLLRVVVGQQLDECAGGEHIGYNKRGAQPQSETGTGSCAHGGQAGGEQVARYARACRIAGRIDEMELVAKE